MTDGSRPRRRWGRGRVVLLAAAACVVVGGAVAYAATRGPAGHPPRGTAAGPSTTASTLPRTTTTSRPPPTTSTTSAGTLPQTDALPPASDAAFSARMQDLWGAVLHDDPTAALPAYFPEAAYIQVKAISDPAADYEDRLIADLRADVGAAHALLGGASGAELVTVSVPEQYAHWVVPGVCANAVGYWEVPNARVVYRVGGAVRSFGIASMISWRGEWYVVHLGAVLRPTGTTAGVVDDPATGPGTSQYSSTC